MGLTGGGMLLLEEPVADLRLMVPCAPRSPLGGSPVSPPPPHEHIASWLCAGVHTQNFLRGPTKVRFLHTNSKHRPGDCAGGGGGGGGGGGVCVCVCACVCACACVSVCVQQPGIPVLFGYAPIPELGCDFLRVPGRTGHGNPWIHPRV